MGDTDERTTPRTIFMDTTMSKQNNAPIGVFDSGCGGLTVLRVLQKQFPHEQFVYYADTANLPYGTKKPEQIIAFTRSALAWLQNVAQVKLIVVACHTSSALALDAIARDCSVPIIGTIMPLLEVILGKNYFNKIGIIATPASAQSKMHEKILVAHGFTGTVHTIACPDFVPLIEAVEQNTAALTAAAQKYLAPFYTESLDTLVYGCTHYPLIADIIEPLLPPNVQCIDPANAIADAVKILLDTQQAHATKSTPQNTHYYCTGDPELFSHKVAHIMHVETAILLKNPLTINTK